MAARAIKIIEEPDMETMKLEQLIQASSGLKNRVATPILADEKPIVELQISLKDNAPCVNLTTEDAAAEPYDVRCAFDETHNEWFYLTSIPQREKNVLDEICKSNKMETEDLIRNFIQWAIREPEKADAWLNSVDEKKV